MQHFSHHLHVNDYHYIVHWSFFSCNSKHYDCLKWDEISEAEGNTSPISFCKHLWSSCHLHYISRAPMLFPFSSLLFAWNYCLLLHRQRHVLFHLFLKPVHWADKREIVGEAGKEGGGDWQECSSQCTLQVCTGSMLRASTKTTVRYTLEIQILINVMSISASCIPAVCMLVIGRVPSVIVVVDVQSFCMVWSWGILNRSGPLPLGTELIIWMIKVIAWLKCI